MLCGKARPPARVREAGAPETRAGYLRMKRRTVFRASWASELDSLVAMTTAVGWGRVPTQVTATKTVSSTVPLT